MALNQNQFAITPIQGMLDLAGFGSNVLEGVVSNTQATVLIPGQAVAVANELTGPPSVISLSGNTVAANAFVTYNLKDISYAANARVGLAIGGSVMYMTAGAAITRWAQIEVDTVLNRVITNAGTNPVVGFAVDKATAAGQLIRVYIQNAADVATSIASVSGLQAALNALQAAILPNEAEVAITTVGSGVLTAAGLVGKLIKRTGPVAAFSDATDTAVAINGALNTYVAGSSFETKIKNATAFPMTITAGTGVTLTGLSIIPPLSVATYLITNTSTVAVELRHVETVSLTTQLQISVTNLTTVGSGTITGAGIAGGVTNRTGSTSAFTDTVDIATNIIAAIPNASVGETFEYTYFNNTGFAATIAAATGTTLSGADALFIPAGTWARFIVTVATGTTVTMNNIANGIISTALAAQFSTGTTATTFTAGELTGANIVVYTNTQATPGSLATRTATQMIADIGNATIGQTWMLRVINGQGTGTLTITAGTDVTLTGTATVAINSWRDFVCTVTSIALHTITMQNAGTGTFS